MAAGKVAIIGIDAAGFDFVSRWAREGRLPNLRRLLDSGARGPLASTLPPLSPPAWSSFMTGRNPGRHGVISFSQLFQDSYRPRFINATHRRGAAFWEVAGRQGVRGGILNVPCTYPPRPFNGFLISGLLSPSIGPGMAAPRSAYRELMRLSPDYQVEINVANKTSPGAAPDFLERALANVEARRKAALGLYRRHKPPLFCVVFTATDRVGHYFFGAHREAHGEGCRSGGSVPFGEALLHVYARVDEAVGELLEELDDDTDVLVLSDHGSGPLSMRLNLKAALAQAGLLERKRPGVLRRLGQRTLLPLVRLLPRTVMRRMIRALGSSADRAMGLYTASDIDFPRSRAYPAGDTGGVFVNVKGRQPQGVVAPGGEYEAARDRLIEALEALRDPETGEPVAGNVFRREEVWAGPRLEWLPDVIMEQRDWRYDVKPVSTYSLPGVFAPLEGRGEQGLYDTGGHTRDGMLLAAGPHVKNAELHGAGIADVPATVLALLGCAIPDDLDGRVLTEMLTDDVEPPQTTRAAEEPESEEADFTDRERDAVEKRLKGLGYL